MASGVGDYGADFLLGVMLGVYPVPAGYWVGLATDEPGPGMDGDILAELEPPRAAGYDRIWIPAGPDRWAMNGGFGANLTALDFGIPTADWGQVGHYFLVDDAFAGNLYAFGEFLAPQQLVATFQVIIPAGGVVWQLAQLENSITP